MRIVLDESKCSSLGMCEAVAPDLFEVGDDGALHLLVVEPPDDRRADVEEAVAACPTGALSIG
ncbi:MAG TPA: ferredoxin [Mycobacteriales bacterium]|nr:ferredoxin [Mycobacteriales bacterium]